MTGPNFTCDEPWFYSQAPNILVSTVFFSSSLKSYLSVMVLFLNFSVSRERKYMRFVIGMKCKRYSYFRHGILSLLSCCSVLIYSLGLRTSGMGYLLNTLLMQHLLMLMSTLWCEWLPWLRLPWARAQTAQQIWSVQRQRNQHSGDSETGN